MVRNYKKKKLPKYDNDSLLLAMETVTKEGKSIRSVAKVFNIPFQTLRKHVLNPNLKCGSGVQTVLSEVEEDHLAHALVYLSECGLPQGRRMLKQIVASFMKSVGRSNPFKDDTPGKDWVQGFEARNRAVLTKRKPEILTVARSKALTSVVVDEFFKMWEDLIMRNNFQEAPDRVFNCDETGLTTNPVHEPVYVGRGAKDAYLKTPNCGKTMFSVLFCASATGKFLPPFTVYKSKNLYDTWTKGGPKSAGYGCSESGWMQDLNFEAWFISIFIPFVSDYEKPVLLTFDGHNSHLTYNTVKEAIQNQIIIMCLPPNTSHALQPLDVGVFKSVKASWRIILTDWFRDSRLKTVDKAVFPLLLKKLWACLNPSHAVNGFRGSGLLPVNRSAVDHRVLAETSRRDDKEVMTPRKALREAIIQSVSPDPDLQVPSKTRRRVQHATGEILTEETVLNRLEEEEKSRKEKKKKTGGNGRSRTGVKRKKKTSVDDLFLETLASLDETLEEEPGTSEHQLVGDTTEIVESGQENDDEEDIDSETAVHVSDPNNNVVNLSKLEEGVSYVLAMYEGSCFPGLVLNMKKKSVEVSCMSKSGLFGWKWPQPPDLHDYPPEDLVAVIKPPKALNKRNNFSVPEADKYWE